MTRITFGLDPSLRNGSLIGIAWKNNEKLNIFGEIHTFKKMFSWNKKDPHSLSMKGPPEETYELVQMIRSALMHDQSYVCAGAPIYIDYDTSAGFRYSNRMLGIRVGFMMGCLYQAFHYITMKPLFIPAKEVREWLGLKPRADKEAVWTVFSQRHCEIRYMDNEHEKDAFILAWMAESEFVDL